VLHSYINMHYHAATDLQALKLLFDASHSAVRLLGIDVIDAHTIEATWLLGGYLKFPWHPRVDAFEGKTVYTLGSDGLIVFQDQTWSVSGAKALLETFTPTAGVLDDIREELLRQ
jgi:hypothetical protein